MPKNTNDINFGGRLNKLRKSAGYTQVELANALNTSQRMIAYYEGQTDHPPATLLPNLAKILNVTTDELLGVEPLKKTRRTDNRLQRRIQQIEKMGTKEKKQVLQLLDTFIEREQLRQQLHDKNTEHNLQQAS